MPHINRQLLDVPVKWVVAFFFVVFFTVLASRHDGTFWAAPPSDEGPAQVAESSGKPLDEDAALLRRVGAKEGLAGKVMDGQMTMLQAAALYRGLDEGPPTFPWEAFRHAYPATCDEESHCREVIAFVRAALAVRGDQEGTLADCLEAELQEHLDRGDLRLPDPATAGAALRQ